MFFIYKAILGKLPIYLSSLLNVKHGNHSLRSLDVLRLTVPRVRTEFGKTAFRFSAPSTWNKLQNEFMIQYIVPLNSFKAMVKSVESRLSLCKCFM